MLIRTGNLLAQDENQDLFDLSFRELMNPEIVSALEKKGTIFTTLLSSYTITGTKSINALITGGIRFGL